MRRALGIHPPIEGKIKGKRDGWEGHRKKNAEELDRVVFIGHGPEEGV